MKFKALALFSGLLLTATLSAQTLTDVINEFNEGVSKVNNQEYDVALEHFNQVLTLAETVGEEADEMKVKAQDQIPQAYYRQATLFLKRKQYDNAIPYLENTIAKSTEFENNAEIQAKAQRYLMQSYMREGQRNLKNQNYEASLEMYDKALAMNDGLYQANLGKGMVYLAQDESDLMLEEFAKAKAGATAKDDAKTIQLVNSKINSYYNRFITEEMEMVDPEEQDYSYVVEACENALAANPTNPRALYHLALISNKNVEYDSAITYAQKALESETEAVWLSAIYFELGNAYQNNVEYDKACEALKNVVEEPFLTRAEKKIASVPGCN